MSSLPKRKVAIVTNDMAIGGIQKVFLNLAKGLAERGVDVDLVLCLEKGDFLAQIPPEQRVIVLANQVAPRKSLWKMVAYLKRERPDAILSGDDSTNIMCLLAKRLSGVKSRSVIATHTMLSRKYSSLHSLKSRLRGQSLRYFYRLADVALAVSKGVAEDHASWTGMAPEQIKLAYNPVLSAQAIAQASEPADHPWLKPGQVPSIISVGRLVALKEFDVLLRAFAKVRAINPSRLIIFGEGDQRDALNALAHELGVEEDFDLPGFTAHPMAAMDKAAVYVLSSRWEGLPTALIEALAVGVPIVSTNCKSGPSEVLADGKWGQLVPVGDVDAMADAILKALRTPKRVNPPESYREFMDDVVVDNYMHHLFA